MSDDTPDAMIDWSIARGTARRLAPAGPTITAAEASEAVDSLRRSALAARGPVADTTRLHTPGDAPEAVVVDRGRWIDANTESFAAMFAPLTKALMAKADARGQGEPPAAFKRVSGALTGVEIGSLMAFLCSRVLGQYDLAPGRDSSAATLLLVAPNIVAVERELGVDPADFRLWVCLHEETHRVQFTAVPWLREHLVGRTTELSTTLIPDRGEFLTRIRALPANARQAARPGSNGLADLVMTPTQRAEIADISAVMALLEGHADVVMDEVGPAVVPSVEAIRSRFEVRRDGLGIFDILIRRLLGLEAKIAQYRDGAAFVRTVVGRVGMDGFNAVWASPATLPSAAEMADPLAWVARVHG